MCPGFQSLTQAGLQHLTSLERLGIWDCPKLQYLTKERRPDSLRRLWVYKCPLLEQRCQFEKGQEWCYIAHIPQVKINGVLIFKPEVNIWRVERRIDTSDLAVFPKPSEPLPCSSEDSLKLETWNRGRLIPGRLHFKHTTKSHISGGTVPLIFQKESCYHGAEAYPFIFAEIEFKRALALSSLEELRISNFPKLQLLDRCALFWNINDNLQTGRLEWLLLHSHYGTTCCF
ncbi:hypothetical protein CK203_064877 [Vitis vinifera]|uniref:Disease resistance protein n=1 Tax=Vitis vinifera TaxID=29760 RepID=A0A438G482_VITVI|nr:hypothetical protein CK203_064877 [Vitis vinifera]